MRIGHVEVLGDDLFEEWWKGIPGPEGDEEGEPGDIEDTTVDVDRIEYRDLASLAVYRIDFWVFPERRYRESHSGKTLR